MTVTYHAMQCAPFLLLPLDAARPMVAPVKGVESHLRRKLDLPPTLLALNVSAVDDNDQGVVAEFPLPILLRTGEHRPHR